MSRRRIPLLKSFRRHTLPTLFSPGKYDSRLSVFMDIRFRRTTKETGRRILGEICKPLFVSVIFHENTGKTLCYTIHEPVNHLPIHILLLLSIVNDL